MTEHDVTQDHDDEDGEDRGKTTVVLDIADPAPGKPPRRFGELAMSQFDPVEEVLADGTRRFVPGT